MKCILFLFDWRGPDSGPCGGIEGKIQSIASEVSKKGLFEPILVTTSTTCTLAVRFAALGFKVHAARMCDPLCFPAAADIERVLKQHEVALLHSHTFRASIVGRLVKRAHPELKHVFRVHTHIEGTETPPLRRRAYHMLDRWTARWADRFVPISECLARELQEHSGVDAAKIKVVHNGIPSPGEPDSPVESADAKLNPEIGIVGKVEERKQQHVAVQAVAKLRDKGIGVKLHLVGGPDEKYMRMMGDLVKDLNLDGSVVFHGYNPRPFDSLKNAPVIILPSRFEGVPTSLIEGMSLRKIVVGTPTGGTAELIRHGVNGFLHQPGDVDVLTHILEQLFAQPARHWEGIRNEGQKTWRQEFYLDVMMNGLIEVYRDLGLI
jgi:glycosyltransferase involved in cell wall biosynthesis